MSYRFEAVEKFLNHFRNGTWPLDMNGVPRIGNNYGSGIPNFTNSFTTDLDIIGHELSHGIIDFEAKLNYRNQSGALNESFADVFGILIKQ